MAKMKKLQPEMEKIRERFKEDRVKQQQELMALYKNEKINPMAGCLPILLQIPVFFALYKVLFVTIDMRHAPFFGWIKDLSAPDPTSLFNLFGLLPYRGARVPARRRVAADHGHDDVGADAAEPAAARSHAAEDLQLDAGDVHVHAGVVPGRPRDLLGLEQRAVAAAAVLRSCARTTPRCICGRTSASTSGRPGWRRCESVDVKRAEGQGRRRVGGRREPLRETLKKRPSKPAAPAKPAAAPKPVAAKTRDRAPSRRVPSRPSRYRP